MLDGVERDRASAAARPDRKGSHVSADQSPRPAALRYSKHSWRKVDPQHAGARARQVLAHLTWATTDIEDRSATEARHRCIQNRPIDREAFQIVGERVRVVSG